MGSTLVIQAFILIHGLSFPSYSINEDCFPHSPFDWVLFLTDDSMNVVPLFQCVGSNCQEMVSSVSEVRFVLLPSLMGSACCFYDVHMCAVLAMNPDKGLELSPLWLDITHYPR